MRPAKYAKTFSILPVLMLSAMLVLIPTGLAQNNDGGGNQRITTENLLEILEAAGSHVNATFTRLEAEGIPIPDTAKDRYDEGFKIAALAVQFRDTGNLEQANEKAIQAMQKFKEASLETAEDVEKTETPDEKEAYEAIGVAAARNRAETYINKLEDLADKAEELGYDVSGIRETLTEARSILGTGASLAEAGNIEEAEREIGKAISTAAKTMGKLQPIVKANKANQAEKFLEKAEERLARLEGRMDMLSGQVAALPPQAQQGISWAQVALENARSRVADVRALLQAGNVEDAIEGLKDMRRDAERAVEEFGGAKPEVAENLAAIQKIEATIDFLRGRLEDAKGKGVNVIEIEEILTRAENILTQSMEHLQNEEIENASQAIDQADKLTDDAEGLLERIIELVEEEAREEARELVEETLKNRAALKQLNATVSLLWNRLADLEGMNVAEIENTLRTAYGLLEEAIRHINEGNIDVASNTIGQAERLIDEANELLEQVRKQAEEKKSGGVSKQGEEQDEDREKDEEAVEQGRGETGESEKTGKPEGADQEPPGETGRP